jgi:hypothetical protein
MRTILWFISQHGYGHASRSSAIIAALLRHNPGVKVKLVTGVARHFFDDSLRNANIEIIPVTCDVGLIQKSPFEADLHETLHRLDALYPVNEHWITSLAAQVGNTPDLVVADTSPAGLAYARHFRLPSVLIENMTWDWLYAIYTERLPDIEKHRLYFRELDNQVTLRLQSIPFCEHVLRGTAISPIARRPVQSAEDIRKRLGIPDKKRMVLMSYGGVEVQGNQLPVFDVPDNAMLVLCGGVPESRLFKNGIHLPHKSDFYMPDLANAADVIIGKLGYSTVAEAAVFGKPFLYQTRADFRETACLEHWVRSNMTAENFSIAAPAGFPQHETIESLISTKTLVHPNGDDQAAAAISALL